MYMNISYRIIHVRVRVHVRVLPQNETVGIEIFQVSTTDADSIPQFTEAFYKITVRPFL